MKRYIAIILMMTTWLAVMGQEEMLYGTGLLEDDAEYEKIPVKPTLLTRDYTILPESYSLKKYCPRAGSQGSFGTCTAWSTTYAARTIAEAIKWGWTDKNVITEEAFAPLFVYAQIKGEGNNSCLNGVHVNHALETLKTKGAPKYRNFSVQCADFIPKWVMDEAPDYLIDDYFTLFSSLCKSYDEKVNKVKKSLSQDNPVLINMHLPRSFYRAGDVWSPTSPDEPPITYHAMCVVAYDDHKDGGAFQIMNSWSETWGNAGFTWVKYTDFVKFVDWAFEIYVKKVRYPEVVPDKEAVITVNNIENNFEQVFANIDSNYKDKEEKVLSGSMHIQLATGEIIAQQLTRWKREIPVYRAKGRFISGTRCRVYLSNNEPAYVYVLGSDLENNVTKLFPHSANVSPALVYSSNDIALPSEDSYIEMDETKGKDYFCLLYSSRALPIDSIINQIKQAQGSFDEKLFSAMDEYGLVPMKDVSYEKGKVSFRAVTKKQVVPIIVELSHK